MKYRYILAMFFLFVLALPLVNSVCTLTLDKQVYNQGDTATVTGNCDENSEKNIDYIIHWGNETNATIEQDTGTTPSVAGTNFFETYIVPADYVAVNGTILNVNLTGTGLEGIDSATVQAATSSSLIISSVVFTEKIYLEKVAGISFTIKDENDQLISNAVCDGILEDGNNFPLSAGVEITTRNGHGAFSRLISQDTFKEGSNYLAIIQCTCGISSTGTACFNETGGEVTTSAGTISAPFSTLTWLTVNTIVDKTNYVMKKEIFISANVTNVDFASRIPLEITHQVRCSAGIDNDDDLDRILIIHDDAMPDKRGISSGTTQIQSKKFMIPEVNYLQGRTSQCYASTEVRALDKIGRILSTYVTTSPVFNITSTELNLDPDWSLSDRTLNSIINLSKFTEINGTGIGDIDIRLRGGFEEIYIERAMDLFNLIKNVTVRNTSSTLTEGVDFVLEFLEDDNIEIEIRNVPLTNTGTEWWNITLEFYDHLLNNTLLQDRQAAALESIENKTGTFHLDVDCEASWGIGTAIPCVITAQVEDTQLVQKEVDFTCYIHENGEKISALNFNKMVTRTPFTITKSFLIPNSFGKNTEHTLQCEARYYNLGSRTDFFFDTFLAKDFSSGGVTPSVGGVPGEPEPKNVIEKIVSAVGDSIGDIIDILTKPGALKTLSILQIIFIFAGLFSFMFLLLVFGLMFRKRNKNT